MNKRFVVLLFLMFPISLLANPEKFVVNSIVNRTCVLRPKINLIDHHMGTFKLNYVCDFYAGEGRNLNPNTQVNVYVNGGLSNVSVINASGADVPGVNGLQCVFTHSIQYRNDSVIKGITMTGPIKNIDTRLFNPVPHLINDHTFVIHYSKEERTSSEFKDHNFVTQHGKGLLFTVPFHYKGDDLNSGVYDMKCSSVGVL